MQNNKALLDKECEVNKYINFVYGRDHESLVAANVTFVFVVIAILRYTPFALSAV